MMKLLSPRLLHSAVLLCASVMGAPAAFAQGTFTPGTGDATNCNIGASGATTDSKTCTVGTVSATMTGWGYTGTTLSGTTQAAGFQQGRLADWDGSGFGVYSGNKETSTTGQHAFDNVTTGCGSVASPGIGGSVTLSGNNSGCGGSIEALLLDFGSAKVNITNVGVGWLPTVNGAPVDADLSVWAWTSSGGPTMTTQTAKGSDTSAETFAAAMTGWTLVSDLNFSTKGTANTGGTLYSSYFLITTYFGAATSTLDAGNDRFKFNSFTAQTCATVLTGGTGGNGSTCSSSITPVPEPTSLALVGVALAGALGTRRRSRNAA